MIKINFVYFLGKIKISDFGMNFKLIIEKKSSIFIRFINYMPIT